MKEEKRSFTDYLKSKKLSEATIALCERHVEMFKEWLIDEGLSIELVDQKEVLGYLQDRRSKGNSNRSLSIQVNSIKKYFNYEQREPNPCQYIQIKGIKRGMIMGQLNEEELRIIYDNHPEKSIQERRDKCMLSLLIYQGLTTKELMNLELKDVAIKLGKIEIRRSSQGAYRQLVLTEAQVKILDDYLKNIRPILVNRSGLWSEQLFINGGSSERKGKLKNTIQELIKRLKRKHSIFKNARQLRASRIRLWLGQYNLREVQYRAGHRYISSTERYELGRVEDLQEALKKYHPNIT